MEAILKVTYDQFFGAAVPDGRAMAWAEEVVLKAHRYPLRVTVGSHLMIDALRVLLARKDLLQEEVEFWFNGVKLNHTQGGRIDPWPRGFCNETEQFLMEIK